MVVSRLNMNSLESQFLEYSVSGRLEVLEVMMFEIDPSPIHVWQAINISTAQLNSVAVRRRRRHRVVPFQANPARFRAGEHREGGGKPFGAEGRERERQVRIVSYTPLSRSLARSWL